nr:hypothetical protein [Saprospiraceae bacterium]
IKEITLDAKSSKDLVSNTKTMESIYRVEIIGDIESYMALETVANTLTDALVGYHDSTIKVIDLSLGHQDGNDEAKIKRFIRDFQIIHI